MATLNVITTYNGSIPFDISVTACDLSTELSLKDFVVLNTSSNTLEDLTYWSKVSQSLIRYNGGSSTLPNGSTLEIRRKTPNLVVQPVSYASRFSSDLWNKELDRMVRWREEADFNGVGPTASGVTLLPVNDIYGVSWASDVLRAPTRQTIYNKIQSLAPLNSPTFSGNSSVPTQPLSSNNTIIANTSFVQGELFNTIAGANPNMAFALGVQKNKLINGRFKVWQQGGVFPVVGGGGLEYKLSPTADMWGGTIYGATVAPSYTISRQLFALNAADIPPYNPKYYLRFNITNAGSGYSSGFVCRAYTLTTDSHELMGKTVTLSGYFRSSVANKVLGIRVLRTSGTGGSTANDLYSGSWNLTSTFQKYSKTFTIPGGSSGVTGTEGTDGFIIFFVLGSEGTEVPSNIPLGGVGTTDFSDVQLELGASATHIQDKTFIEEYINCCRYYQKSGVYGSPQGTITTAGFYAEYPVGGIGPWSTWMNYILPMRKIPSISISSSAGTFGVMSRNGVNATPAVMNATTNGFLLYNNSGTTGSYFYFDWSANAFE